MSMKEITGKITLSEPMLGTVPADKEVYRRYIETKKPPAQDEDESLDVKELEEKGWTVFREDKDGLYIYDYMVKGFLKNAANQLKEVIKIKNARSKVNNYVFMFPRKIYIGKDKADGVIERPLQAMTMQGPRTSLARSDYVDAGTSFEFTLRFYEQAGLTEKKIKELFEYGQLMGLGQFRNGSYGRFNVEWR